MKMIKYLLLIVILFNQILFSQTNLESLQKIQNSLKKLDCIFYTAKLGKSASGDTVIVSSRIFSKKFMFDDSDKSLGCRFLSLSKDTTCYTDSYHNDSHTSYNWNSKTYKRNSINPEFPPLKSPFYSEVHSLLKYVIKNNDSLNFSIIDNTDSIKFCFIFNKPIYFKKNPLISNLPEQSKYYIWTNKDYMPYKIKRLFSHQTTIEEILYKKNINCKEILDFQNGSNIPNGFHIDTGDNKRIYSDILEGQKAPVWKLLNIKDKYRRLDDFKGENILIEFTSIACGPCNAARPYLNTLIDKYNNKLKVISIFVSSDSKFGIERYLKANPMNFEILRGQEDTFLNYKIHGVPVFIFINKLDFPEPYANPRAIMLII